MSGIGMHTGRQARAILRPASSGGGIRFITGGVIIPAVAANVTDTRRCTSLGLNGAAVSTVEHLLSALTALEIDNLDIVVEGGEIPILDGSAQEWTAALQAAGTAELSERATLSALAKPFAAQLHDCWMVATPADSLSITCITQFEHPLLGTEVVTYHQNPGAFAREVAPARTFGFIEEVGELRAAGLAQGGSLENALIIYPDRFSTELRLPNECNRHKLLDLIGDLSLVGTRFTAAVTAVKPSHRANVEFARLLSAHLNPSGA